MNVLERARASGKCPPSLFLDEPKEGSFETAVAKVLDANDLVLSSGGSFNEDFKQLMQMASSASDTPGDKDTQMAILAQRRCIILAIVGATPSSNSSLGVIMQAGFLSAIKTWLDDILAGKVGGVDLLLHLLTNIIELPVTKSVVKDSGMGKAIGSIEKHQICAGTLNEAAVRERVDKIKAAWNKSVKALKEKEPPQAQLPKRQIEYSQSDTSPINKKARTEEKKPSTFSSLLKKVNTDSSAAKTLNLDGDKSSASTTKESPKQLGDSKMKNGDNMKTEKKKQKKRVKWQDHFGGDLTASRTIEGDDSKPDEPHMEGDASVSWSDRRRRDRLKEKELLSKVKKSKLVDDDDEYLGMDSFATQPNRMIPTMTTWKPPSLLPIRADAPPPQVQSAEAATQNARIAGIARAQYVSEYNVPSSPAPMSDVEQALDMTNQSSTITQAIPFFVPQAPEPVEIIPVPAPAIPVQSYPQYGLPPPNPWGAQPAPAGLSIDASANIATPEFVQSLGLPLFLVGHDTQALQTLASTPSLLSTFVDSNGMYDQARLTSLVQTLSQNSNPAPQAPGLGHLGGYQPSTVYGGGSQSAYGATPSVGGGIYGPASTGAYGPASGSSYGSSWQNGVAKSGSREQKSDEGNLHVSGYGPTTTQTDIINLFAPYVQVDEVVLKGSFAFVNTSDPLGANRAREALSGALLGGAPIRINPAQRKKRDSAPSSLGSNLAATSLYGSTSQTIPGLPSNPPMVSPSVYPTALPPPVSNMDVNAVRDDRGNPATKNLFVAGYGQGTTELQLRELFGQYAQIIGIIVKGSFSFVNTSDRVAAVRAREMLSGTMLNGGVLRINFAKESGRLGTSFDVTYNNVAGGGGVPALSHYGRH